MLPARSTVARNCFFSPRYQLTPRMSGTKIWLRAETKPAEARSARKYIYFTLLPFAQLRLVTPSSPAKRTI